MGSGWRWDLIRQKPRRRQCSRAKPGPGRPDVPSSVGRSTQNGKEGPSSFRGSSHANRPHDEASRSTSSAHWEGLALCTSALGHCGPPLLDVTRVPPQEPPGGNHFRARHRPYAARRWPLVPVARKPRTAPSHPSTSVSTSSSVTGEWAGNAVVHSGEVEHTRCFGNVDREISLRAAGRCAAPGHFGRIRHARSSPTQHRKASETPH